MRIPTIALVLVMILAAIPCHGSERSDYRRHTEHRTTPSLAEALANVSPGDTLTWQLDDGQVDTGALLMYDEHLLTMKNGNTVEAARIDALWQRHWSRSPGFTTRSGVGIGLGMICAAALVNHERRDSGGLENLGVVLGAGIALAVPSLIGVLAAMAAPEEPGWALIHARDPDASVAMVPPGTELYALQDSIWFETGGELASVGWGRGSSGSPRVTAGLWMPLWGRQSVGLTAGYGRRPSFEDSTNSDVFHPWTASLVLRSEFAGKGRLRPYFGVGVGHFGQLGGTNGWTVSFGVNSRVGAGQTVRTEVGTTGGFKQLDGDRPGLAYFALKLDLDI